MKDYWMSEHTEALKDYYYSTTMEGRCRIIDKVLHKPLYEMAKRCLSNFGLAPDMERQQDIVIHLIYKAMPRLREDKLDGGFQYLWISAKNYTLTYILKPIKDGRATISHLPPKWVCSCTVDAVNLDEEYEREAYKRMVLDEIDLKLKGQHIINTTNAVFLLLLRDYLIEHDFDARGFGDYVMHKMHLKLSTYRAIAGRLRLRTKHFNEKI